MAQAMTPLKKLREALAQDRTRRDARGARSRGQGGSVTITKAPTRVCASSTVSARRGKNRDLAESGPSGSAATTSSDISASSETSDSESSDDSSTTDDDTWGLATRVARGAAPRRREPNDGELQACYICGKTFLLRSSVRRHIRAKHTDERLRPHYICESRDLAISAARGAAPRRRERTDGELQACHICGKTFRLTSSVRRHMRTKHTDEFLRQHYTCENRDLDDSTAPATALRRKLKGEGPHVCHICERTFARRSCVRRHMMTKHMGERPYQCPICQRRFAQKVSLTRHQQTHAGEKLHECPECGGKFASERYLRRHQLTHTGAMPYECRICPAAFARKDTLNCHLLTHTGERPYECDACGARFSDKAALRHHRLTHARRPVASDHSRSSGTSSPLITTQEDDDEQMHENATYHCRPCGRNFVRKETLASHIEQHAG
ncbi:zinc finger protein 184-like isoform X1 [Dermacentor silvarum]|uniref:zinc finger protein 184-like isoform X1 n=1 Tax=Dermacentor silvarum TaxID=543639 RepID=UPI00189AE298|nr:zinc finger protein 184-like isoform X1 [Dermacentor silvarum]